MEKDKGDSAIGTPTRAECNPLALRSGPLTTPFIPRRGYADGPFGQIHFRDTSGGSDIPLLLLHQAPQTSKQFTAVYEPLQKRGIRAIGIDLPGFGESDPAPYVPTVEDWAAIVPAVLDHLGLSTAHILGHHTGGMVATEAAIQFPDRIQKLVINGPLIQDDETQRRHLTYVQENEVDVVYESDGSHLQQSFATRFKLFGEGADPQTITRYVVEKFQGYAPFFIGHHAAFLYDHASALKKLSCPTMILTNTGDMINKDARAAHELRPDFAFTELQGGGIDVVDQMPDAWADAVAAFLDD